MVVGEGGTFGPDRELTPSMAALVFARVLAEISPTRAEFAAIMRAGVDVVDPPDQPSVDLPAPAPDAPETTEPEGPPIPPRPNTDPGSGCAWVFIGGVWDIAC